MTSRQAQCSCGQLSVSCVGDPVKVSICHCDACRRRTGSAFGIAAFFPCEHVTRRGTSRAFRREADSGHPVTFYFCPSCGSTVYWEASRKPDLVGVAAGAFADPDLPMPEQSVWDSRRYGWIDFPAPMRRRPES
ncbi:MAG TPA: GFA family protein [Steroidobacteraceae bacterium]|nr:GFA family protein [Steroidobacteraceae bacterium]